MYLPYNVWSVPAFLHLAPCCSFTHGVLNTDNMSILGDTIDYGPYGFLERFNPDFTPNTTDLQGRRYAFRNQPSVCQWNCAQLANALLAADLLPLVRCVIVNHVPHGWSTPCVKYLCNPHTMYMHLYVDIHTAVK